MKCLGSLSGKRQKRGGGSDLGNWGTRARLLPIPSLSPSHSSYLEQFECCVNRLRGQPELCAELGGERGEVEGEGESRRECRK